MDVIGNGRAFSPDRKHPSNPQMTLHLIFSRATSGGIETEQDDNS